MYDAKKEVTLHVFTFGPNVRRRRPSPSPSRVFSRVHSVLLSQGASVQKYFTSSVIINKAKILITLIESHHETMKLF